MKYPRGIGMTEMEFQIPKNGKIGDCGLVHNFGFAIEKNKNLGIAIIRNNRATSIFMLLMNIF